MFSLQVTVLPIGQQGRKSPSSGELIGCQEVGRAATAGGALQLNKHAAMRRGLQKVNGCSTHSSWFNVGVRFVYRLSDPSQRKRLHA